MWTIQAHILLRAANSAFALCVTSALRSEKGTPWPQTTGTHGKGCVLRPLVKLFCSMAAPLVERAAHMKPGPRPPVSTPGRTTPHLGSPGESVSPRATHIQRNDNRLIDENTASPAYAEAHSRRRRCASLDRRCWRKSPTDIGAHRRTSP